MRQAPATKRQPECRQSINQKNWRLMVAPLLHCLDACDQVGMLLAVFLPDRFYRLLKCFFVVYLDDFDPGCLDLSDRALLHRIPEPALFLLCLAPESSDQRLVVLAKSVPGPLREHQD